MAKKIRIKDIAALAGVSAGTVDRVLHNRGSVAEDKRLKIEEVLKKMNYSPNIHLSAISLKKTYRFVIAIPDFSEGEYWFFAEKGIRQAFETYSALDIVCEFCYYNHFDLFSCRDSFEQVILHKPDAVIIGPTFRDETIHLSNQLSDMGIPYVFIDSAVEGASPLAFYSSNPYTCGYLIAKLITNITPKGADIALLQAIRIGDESANATILRKAGFMAYYNEHNLQNKLYRVNYSALDNEQNEKLLNDFFKDNQETKGAVILNSRAHVITDYMKKHEIHNIKFVGIDLTEKNNQAIREGCIDFLIGQRPEQQGYMAVKTLIQYLVFGKSAQVTNYMPIDIIVKENADLYSGLTDFVLDTD
ncbi:LacI family DNA-binding transcriptional regulator [Bacteroides sp. 224]|uniref:LacI family DNA-binding transcriptional regulator n=1 Tax=Bacteroides sp. 224 TaxID=2302936 RepID=UPI0013D87F71|nr:LacI family DNA-binding transcriptional regulator [Bacteroides sp. 224]NDV67230.1 LacI family DNA-binding transcriptional regulator [Bacteroides sp. 224]